MLVPESSPKQVCDPGTIDGTVGGDDKIRGPRPDGQISEERGFWLVSRLVLNRRNATTQPAVSTPSSPKKRTQVPPFRSVPIIFFFFSIADRPRTTASSERMIVGLEPASEYNSRPCDSSGFFFRRFRSDRGVKKKIFFRVHDRRAGFQISRKGQQGQTKYS